MLLSLPRLLQTERARFLDGGHQLLVQHGEGWVRMEVQAIKASVSPAEKHRERHHQTNSLKGAVCSFRERHYNQKRNKLNEPTLFLFMTELMKMTMTVSFCFTLFIYGGPCHLSSLFIQS